MTLVTFSLDQGKRFTEAITPVLSLYHTIPTFNDPKKVA